MKRAFLLLLGIAFLTACKKDGPQTLLTIALPPQTFTVDPSLNAFLTHYLTIGNVQSTALNALQSSNLDTAAIQAIVPSRATVSVLFGGQRLNWIRAMSIRLCPSNEQDPNCGREIFWRDPVPENAGSSLGLNPSAIDDISNLLLQDRVNIQIKLEQLRSNPPATMDIRVELEFDVQ